MPELSDEMTRELLIGNYRLMYEIRPNALYILRPIHDARDFAALSQRERR